MRYIILCAFVLCACFVFAEDVPTWRGNYEKGLQLEAQAKYDEAVSYLKMAVLDKPISEILADGGAKIEYLPYLHLGICYFEMGKPLLAAEYLQVEKSLSALSQSNGGQKLMAMYEARVKAEQKTGSESVSDDAIRQFTKKPYVLNEKEVAAMKEEIREQCKLPKASEEAYPWYYHYELGLAMSRKNDWQRALDSFLMALDHHDHPQKLSRIYGMWFIDYYPYYQIGVAHANLQNWKCADSSFRLSQMFEDIPRDSSEFRSLQEYTAEVKEKVAE